MKNPKAQQRPEDYLKAADPILGSVIERVTLKPFKANRNYFEALVVEIISQQLSGRVADVMEARFRALFTPLEVEEGHSFYYGQSRKAAPPSGSTSTSAEVEPLTGFAPREKRVNTRMLRSLWDGRARIGFPEPKAVLAMSDAKLRTAGISFSKISYIKNVARSAEEGALEPARLRKLPDEEIIATLTTIKGIGRWTAEMFLMFTLARPDVFSYGDLGLRKAMIRLYRLRKPPTPQRAAQISAPWRPYRTLASRYLWASVDG